MTIPKDLADLFKNDPKGFKPAVEALKADALPAGAAPPRTRYSPLLGGTLAHIGERKLAPVDAVATPLRAWNCACRDEGGGVGIARGWNVIIAGNTGHGKSLLGLNVAVTAINCGERVAYHSLEMSRDQLVTRALAIASGISVRRLEHGADYCRPDWETASLRMMEIHERMGGVLCVNDGPIVRLEDLVAAIKYQTQYQGCRFHIVDYLQLCRVAGTKDVIEAVPVVSGTMRELAKELNVVMVGLSQFNRDTSKNRDQKPQVQGLMGGSALENDADQVLLLNHAKYVKNGHYADTEVLLAKNRHGTTPDMAVRWDYRTLTLTETGEPEHGGEGVGLGDAWEREAA